MPQIDDLKTAVANSIAKTEAVLALVQKLVAAAQTNPPSPEVQAAIDALNAETVKEDAALGS